MAFHPVASGHQPRLLVQFDAFEARQHTSTNAEIAMLLSHLPTPVQNALVALAAKDKLQSLDNLMELNVQIGRKPEAIYVDSQTGKKVRVVVVDAECTANDILLFRDIFHEIPADGGHKRIGIPQTLHRLSLTTHPGKNNSVIAVTSRVGRAMVGVVQRMSPFLLPNGPPLPPFASSSTRDKSSSIYGLSTNGLGAFDSGRQFLSSLDKKVNPLSSKSLLLIGKPGVGKTTLLRELAQNLSDDMSRVVCVVDKTCEIAGDGESPHHAIGSSRWMPVSRPGLQAQILRECVENQSPDIIICDEISTSEEVECVRSISQRGVCLIATVHGSTLPELVNDGERRNLVGGQSNVTLTDAAAERRPDKRKQVSMRLREPPFEHAIELHERNRWVYHPNLRDSIDAYYSGEPCKVLVLEPGRVLEAFALPDSDSFSYCLDCGRIGSLCTVHTITHGAQTASLSTPNSNYRNNRSQKSGTCYSCGLYGHYSYECPSRR